MPLLSEPPLHLLPEPVLHEPFWADVKAALPGATHLELTAHTQSQGQAAPGSGSGVAVDTPSHEQVTDADLQALEAYEARGGTVAELRGGGPTPPQGGATAEAGALEGTTDPAVRLFHGHGHTVQEMFAIRTGRVGRMPDAVVFPTSHEQVVALVQAAHAHARFVTLMPFGGGTSVSGALECPEDETRSIIVVSTRRMNKVLWVDRESMQACVQAGILGIELESQLKEQGLTMGHEPDSYEFSSLGGWVATRASGMKKNVYGNIEDIVIGARCVTPAGVMSSASLVPRQSTGPDPLQLVLGSEGTLGIITDVVVTVHNVPEARAYGSMVFPTFAAGVAFMREVAAERAQPASIRLVDNEQFQFGQSLKARPSNPFLTAVKDTLQKAYVTKVAGFNPDTMVAATLMFEGKPDVVARHQAQVYALGRKHGGMVGGEANGIRGYFLTYMIAYVRDFAMRYWFLAESFETSVPWGQVMAVCENTKATIRGACRRHGVKGPIYVSCRVTQTYDTGACVYFYFGFMHKGLPDPLGVFSAVEGEARSTILSLGGSLSHHHGIGKHRAQFLRNILTPASAAAVRGAKAAVDPANVMGAANALFAPHAHGLGKATGHADAFNTPHAPTAYAPFAGEASGGAALGASVAAGIREFGDRAEAKL